MVTLAITLQCGATMENGSLIVINTLSCLIYANIHLMQCVRGYDLATTVDSALFLKRQMRISAVALARTRGTTVSSRRATCRIRALATASVPRTGVDVTVPENITAGCVKFERHACQILVKMEEPAKRALGSTRVTARATILVPSAARRLPAFRRRASPADASLTDSTASNANVTVQTVRAHAVKTFGHAYLTRAVRTRCVRTWTTVKDTSVAVPMSPMLTSTAET